MGHTANQSIPLSVFPIQMDKFCICLCGLPGRGKTHLSRRLASYLSFFHAVPVEVFNVSEYRRRMFGVVTDSFFFHKDNEEAKELRNKVNADVNAAVFDFLKKTPNGIAILDSTHATYERRATIVNLIHSTGAKIMFLEISCDNTLVLEKNYANVISGSPDYEGVEKKEAEKDYASRVAAYEQCFETINSGKYPVEARWSFLKCDSHRQHFEIHNVKGYLQLKVVHFIISMRTEAHQFFLSRHGQSEYNAVGRIGGDSGLSAHGLAYAHKLAEFVEENICHDAEMGRARPARLWTSTMRRTKETAQFVKQSKLAIRDDDDPTLEHEWVQMRPRAWHHLDELFAGACDGMTYEEIEVQFPEEFERRSKDKLAYRYPRGESYLDVIARLEPIVIEMERHREPLLIVGHQGILRIIYGFYMGLSRAETPYVSIPLNVVVQLAPTPFECSAERHELYDGFVGEDGQNEPHTQRDPQSH